MQYLCPSSQSSGWTTDTGTTSTSATLHRVWQLSICSPMLTIDQAQRKKNGNKMKKRVTETNNADTRCTSINQEGAKMYIMTSRSLKSTKQMHFIFKKM